MDARILQSMSASVVDHVLTFHATSCNIISHCHTPLTAKETTKISSGTWYQQHKHPLHNYHKMGKGFSLTVKRKVHDLSHLPLKIFFFLPLFSDLCIFSRQTKAFHSLRAIAPCHSLVPLSKFFCLHYCSLFDCVSIT